MHTSVSSTVGCQLHFDPNPSYLQVATTYKNRTVAAAQVHYLVREQENYEFYYKNVEIY